MVWQLNGRVSALYRCSVGQPAAEPRETTGAQAALGEVVDAAGFLVLFPDHHSVARRVATSGTVVPLLNVATGGHRLPRIVPRGVGHLTRCVESGCLLAPRHRIVPRGWHHTLLLPGRVERRSLFHVALRRKGTELECPAMLGIETKRRTQATSTVIVKVHARNHVRSGMNCTTRLGN